ncbi:MAG TPA: hypothetical protein VK117_04105 [Pyrinomonadaceae bacterium]|nr:hypothetical protein [Pyrinomonadaceae bacterium]
MATKVSLGFGRPPDTELDNFAQGVIDALTGDAAFRFTDVSISSARDPDGIAQASVRVNF